MATDERAWARPAGLVLGWIAVAALAITIGVVAVTTVGASLRGRGPLGNEVVRSELQEAPAQVDDTEPRIRRTIREEFGELDVACQGVYAVGIEARPDREAGWRTVSYETGPDDDVDAVFANQGRSIEVEVYCNRGEPTIAEIERNTLPDD